MVADPSAGIMSHAIQLAIAPVFLLTGIAGLLAVIANRLGRIIDRARSLEQLRLSMSAVGRSTSARQAHCSSAWSSSVFSSMNSSA